MANGSGTTISPTTLLVVALLGGGGANLGGHLVGLNRPDPFTGAEGTEMEKRIMIEVAKLRRDVEDEKVWRTEHTQWGFESLMKQLEKDSRMNERINICCRDNAKEQWNQNYGGK